MGLIKKTSAGTSTVTLGKRYRDTVHGVEGVAVAKYVYLTGCDRVCLEWPKDGDIKSATFDVTQLEAVSDASPVRTTKTAGGPGRVPPSKSTGGR